MTPFAGERGGRGPGRDARDGGPGLGFMGGGLGEAFAGGPGSGRGFERGFFKSGLDTSGCTVAGDDVTCGPTTRDGITVTRVYTFKTAAGASQTAPDANTDTERSRITTSGTRTSMRRDSITVTVQHSSNRTVTGLASTSTQRTVNGASSGTESVAGVNRDGERFTSVRETSDATVGLVIPVSTTGQSYPTAGSITRNMKLTLTLAGGSPVVKTRKEVVTYSGGTTATVVITTDGTSKTCSLPLPRGRLSCPE
jgi:hypothetical protein